AGISRLRVTAARAYKAKPSGRAVGVRLAARGSRLELSLDGSAEGEEVLVDPAWTPTSLMTTARWSHTATRPADGRGLPAGGTAVEASVSAEIYDPASGAWKATQGKMPTPHSDHVAALLCDGRVLVAGGFSSDSTASRTAALYDPAADTWASAAPMH